MHAAETELRLEQTPKELGEAQQKALDWQQKSSDMDSFIRSQLKKEKARTPFVRCANPDFE